MAIYARDDLSNSEKNAAARDIRRSAIRGVVQNALPFTYPFTKNGALYAITVTRAALIPGGVEMDLTITRNGQPVAFNNPWRVINPPILVPDNGGDVLLPGKIVDGVEVGARRMAESPLRALKAMAERLV